MGEALPHWGCTMRRTIYQSDAQRALDLMRRADVFHLATTTSEGAPLLRTLHGVVVDDYIAFHGAPAGEKIDALGRSAVLTTHETIASIPSYFRDPKRACPATTFYLSSQVSGVVEAVNDPDRKAAILQALMSKYQPEGGYQTIDADDSLYRNALKKILIGQVSLQNISGKAPNWVKIFDQSCVAGS